MSRSFSVRASYGMFYLADWDAVAPDERLPLFGRNGLVAPSQVIAVILTGLRSGPVDVEIVTSTEEPELDRESAWEEVVEVSVHFP